MWKSLTGSAHRVKRGGANEDYLQLGGTSCRWRCPVNRGGWRHSRCSLATSASSRSHGSRSLRLYLFWHGQVSNEANEALPRSAQLLALRSRMMLPPTITPHAKQEAAAP